LSSNASDSMRTLAGDSNIGAGRSTTGELTTRPGVVGVALLAGVLAAGHVGKLPLALPAIRTELHLDLVAAGWLASIFSATGMVIAIFLGAASDRINHWRMAVGGLALMAVSGLGGSLASTMTQLLISRFLEGVGFLAVVVAAPSMIARAASGRARSTALGLWPGYMPAGISLMILAAPFVLQVGGWRALWVVIAAATAAATIAMLLYGEKARPRDTQAADAGVPLWENFRQGVSQVGAWYVAGCFALYGAQLYAIVTWMPTFLIEQRGIGPATAAGLTAFAVVINGVCNILGSVLLRRGVAPWLMMAASGAVMLVSAAGAFTDVMPDLVRYACSVILCGAGGVVASGAFAIAPSFARSPTQIGTVNGILVQASNVAQFVGPTALAAAVARFGRWESAVWLMVGANVLLIVLALFVHRQGKLLPV
jgi:CP family cyanate transporter-like MFS transporter